MNFDLEIQPDNIELVNIEEGWSISNSLTPLYYYKVDKIGSFPSDLVEIDEPATSIISSNLPIIKIDNGSNFISASDNFLLTHVNKYSTTTGARTPLFYKHTIKLTGVQTQSSIESIINTIGIYDADNNQLNTDLYFVETDGSSIYVYLNKVSELMFIQYNTSLVAVSEILKFTPIFEEVSFDYILDNSTLKTFQYVVNKVENGFSVLTGYSGGISMLYKNNVSLVSPPIGEIQDPWYLRISNANFNYNNFPYSIPEYYIQRLNQDIQIQNFELQSAKILDSKYIKTQVPVAKEDIENVSIFIINTLTSTYEYAFTTNKELYDTIWEIGGLKYIAIEDYNYDGIFELPVNLENTHQAQASYTYVNNDYIFQILDLNSMDMNISNLIGIYMVPTVSNLQVAVFHSYIGMHQLNNDGSITNNTEKFGMFGAGFDTQEDYMDFIKEKNCFHLCYVSLNINKIKDMVSLSDCRTVNNELFDPTNISKEDTDIFIGDILNNKITIPYSGSVIINIDNNVFDNTNSINSETKNQQYKDFVLETAKKNLEVTTQAILK